MCFGLGIARHRLDLAADARGRAIARLTAKPPPHGGSSETPMLADVSLNADTVFEIGRLLLQARTHLERFDVLPTVFRL